METSNPYIWPVCGESSIALSANTHLSAEYGYSEIVTWLYLADSRISLAAASSEGSKNHCPLCHLTVPSGEEGWKNHLMGPNGCKQNPRRNSKQGKMAETCSKIILSAS